MKHPFAVVALAYVVFAAIALSFWGAVIYFGVKLVKAAWG